MREKTKKNEIKINSLNKEKDLQAEKYKNVFDQLNFILLDKKEKEKNLKEAIEKMNLSNNLSYLINMNKADLISLFNEKEKYLTSLDKENKSLKNKNIELEKKLKIIEEERNDLNFKNNSLKKRMKCSKKK